MNPGKRIAIFCVSLILAMFLILPAFKIGAEVVHMGIPTVGLTDMPAEVAIRMGFYKEEGLDVRKVIIKTGIQVAAILAGEIDYTTVCGTMLRAAVKGVPIRVVMGWFDKPLQMLISRPGLKKITDLKGKRIAISSFGSTPHVLVRETLAKNGMNPDKDVIILSIGGSSSRFAALRAGSVDAAPLDVAYVNKTEALGFENLIYFGDVVDLPFGGLCVAKKKIDENPEQIKRVIRASMKGIRYIKDNKQGTIKIMQSYLGLSPDYSDKIYDFTLRSLTDKGSTAESSRHNEVRMAKERLKITKEIPESQLYDWRLVNEVLSGK